MRNKILACSLIGLGLPFTAAAEAPKVAVDIAPLHSLVSQVMEGVSQPDLIIPAEASPHDFSLRPSQAKALANSEIVFWMGEELTPWLEKAMNNVAGSAKKIGMLDLETTTIREFREGATFEEHVHHDEEGHDDHGYHHDEHEEEHGHHDDDHEHEHEPGLIDRFLSLFGSHDHEEADHDDHDEHHEQNEDHHEGVDPHAWLDPQNAKNWIVEIKNVLVKHDPENAKTYENNAAKADAELDTLIAQTRSEIESLGTLKYIVFHDAYQYFEKQFDISAAGSISLSDAEDPSPARISEIRDTVKKLGVNCVFAEPQHDAGLVKNVFEGSNITAIGVIDPLGANIKTGSQHYPDLIKGMVTSLAQCNK